MVGIIEDTEIKEFAERAVNVERLNESFPIEVVGLDDRIDHCEFLGSE